MDSFVKESARLGPGPMRMCSQAWKGLHSYKRPILTVFSIHSERTQESHLALHLSGGGTCA